MTPEPHRGEKEDDKPIGAVAFGKGIQSLLTHDPAGRKPRNVCWLSQWASEWMSLTNLFILWQISSSKWLLQFSQPTHSTYNETWTLLESEHSCDYSRSDTVWHLLDYKKRYGFHLALFGVLTLGSQPPCHEEAQAATERGHIQVFQWLLCWGPSP